MRLIDEASGAWRLWSVRLAALAGGIAAAVVASPSLLLGLVGFVPEGWRPVAAALTGALVFVVPTAVRLLHQGGGDDCPK